mmetsp:Transcript_39927/g.114414  ORF Transcript_39927/g.114414 Transcript_39927/m.114414 type:complete len:250 (-) Transcript_39927:1253-2002(-)
MMGLVVGLCKYLGLPEDDSAEEHRETTAEVPSSVIPAVLVRLRGAFGQVDASSEHGAHVAAAEREIEAPVGNALHGRRGAAVPQIHLVHLPSQPPPGGPGQLFGRADVEVRARQRASTPNLLAEVVVASPHLRVLDAPGLQHPDAHGHVSERVALRDGAPVGALPVAGPLVLPCGFGQVGNHLLEPHRRVHVEELSVGSVSGVHPIAKEVRSPDHRQSLVPVVWFVSARIHVIRRTSVVDDGELGIHLA